MSWLCPSLWPRVLAPEHAFASRGSAEGVRRVCVRGNAERERERETGAGEASWEQERFSTSVSENLALSLPSARALLGWGGGADPGWSRLARGGRYIVYGAASMTPTGSLGGFNLWNWLTLAWQYAAHCNVFSPTCSYAPLDDCGLREPELARILRQVSHTPQAGHPGYARGEQGNLRLQPHLAVRYVSQFCPRRLPHESYALRHQE